MASLEEDLGDLRACFDKGLITRAQLDEETRAFLSRNRERRCREDQSRELAHALQVTAEYG